LDLLGGRKELQDVKLVLVVKRVALHGRELAAEWDDGIGLHVERRVGSPLARLIARPSDYVRRLYVLIASTDSANHLVLYLAAGV
jgi:hypothetical protein